MVQNWTQKQKNGAKIGIKMAESWMKLEMQHWMKNEVQKGDAKFGTKTNAKVDQKNGSKVNVTLDKNGIQRWTHQMVLLRMQIQM